MKKLFSVLFCVMITFINLSGCRKSKDAPENQTIKYNLDNEPRTLDPQVCNDASSNIVIINIFEGLVRIDANEKVVPGVAYSWEISEDKLTYTFHLRENATWSDKEKTPVTADDFVFGFQRALDSYTKSPKACTLYCIKNARKINIDDVNTDLLGVNAADSHTLVIELEYPMENFLSLLATPPTMPCNRAFFEKTNGQYGLESSTIICNGAFKVKSRYGWDHYNTLNLVINENYCGQNLPVPAGVAFTIGKDTSDTVNLINNATIDAALLPSEEQIVAAKSKKLPLISFKDTLWFLAFNTQDALFSNFDIRRGFLAALSREHILSSIPENCEIIDNIVLNGLTVNGQNFRDSSEKSLYLKADSNAKNYLETGINQLKLKTLPKVTILCLDTPAVKTIVSNMIESLNANLGYYFNMEPLSSATLKSRTASANYQVAFLPFSVESQFALDFLSIFKSDNSKNFVNLSSPDYDKLLNDALSSTPQDSLRYLIDAEKYLNDNAILYPMLVQNRLFAHSNKISNLIFHNYNQGIDFFFATKVK